MADFEFNRKSLATNRLFLIFTILVFFASVYTTYLLKEEFQAINEPVLEISNVLGLSNETIGLHPLITVMVSNLSKRAVKIDSAEIGLRYFKEGSDTIFTKEDDDVMVIKNPLYMGVDENNTIEVGKFTSKIKVDQDLYAKWDSYNPTNTIFGIIYYRNYINNKPRYYYFSVTIDPCHHREFYYQERFVLITHISVNTDVLSKPFFAK